MSAAVAKAEGTKCDGKFGFLIESSVRLIGCQLATIQACLVLCCFDDVTRNKEMRAAVSEAEDTKYCGKFRVWMESAVRPMGCLLS